MKFFFWIFISGVVISLLGAIFARLGTRIVAKFVPPFGITFVAAYIGTAFAQIMTFSVFTLLGRENTRPDFGSPALYILLAVCFSVKALLYGNLLMEPREGPIGYKRASIIALIEIVCFVLFIAVVGFTISTAIRRYR